MFTPDLFSKAMEIAVRTHAGKLDRGGNPYILHPIRIMFALSKTGDLHLMALALMHDVVEDSTMSWDELSNMGFPEDFIDDLKTCTHLPGDDYLEDYIKGFRYKYRACLVKAEDLRDNSDITRLKGVREKDIQRMVKYHKAWIAIQSFISEIVSPEKKSVK